MVAMPVVVAASQRGRGLTVFYYPCLARSSRGTSASALTPSWHFGVAIVSYNVLLAVGVFASMGKTYRIKTQRGEEAYWGNCSCSSLLRSERVGNLREICVRRGIAYAEGCILPRLVYSKGLFPCSMVCDGHHVCLQRLYVITKAQRAFLCIEVGLDCGDNCDCLPTCSIRFC